ncbi:hypothetical protein AGMMS49941_13040 [Deferribacterales bacterium]|nr:hypothetical protein AGMMS49941_13040 [Deferribacterales bacterium]
MTSTYSEKILDAGMPASNRTNPNPLLREGMCMNGFLRAVRDHWIFLSSPVEAKNNF